VPKETAYCVVVEAYVTDVVANIATIKPLTVGDFRTGSIGGALAATLTYYASTTEGGTYELMENSAGTDYSTVKAANLNAQIPEGVMQGAKYLKIINDAAAETMRLTFKS
jgi:hypothetical protein